MTAVYLGLAAVAVLVLFALICRALMAHYQRQDAAAWKPVGYSYRYSGHDESKAPIAAKRADAMAERRQQLALLRAGLTPRPSRPADVTPIAGRRKAVR